MSKVVYLLGAGASRGTRDENNRIKTGLPIVKEIEGELGNLIKILDSIQLDDEIIDDSRKSLIRDFKELKEICASNSTVDSYAKKLWIRRDMEKFGKVELLLTVFFILQQIIHKPDVRYADFLSKVTKSDVVDGVLKLCEDISILSWNYDNQIELAYRSFFKERYTFIREMFGIYDAKGDEGKQLLHNCRIFKLNGTANFSQEEDWLSSSDTNTIDKDILERILNKYELCKKRGLCEGMVRLNFAWEDWFSKNMIANKIPLLVNDAQTLVVIGYSYPDYNRDIDRKIFENMPNLKNIYIQDIYPERIKRNIIPVIPKDRCEKINFILLDDVEQFYLPSEL